MYDTIIPFLYLRSLQSGFPFLDFPRIHPSQLVEPDFLEFVELALLSDTRSATDKYVS